MFCLLLYIVCKLVSTYIPTFILTFILKSYFFCFLFSMFHSLNFKIIVHIHWRMQKVYVHLHYCWIKYALITAARVQWGLSLVENMCTGSVWLDDYMYVRSNIGSWHHWNSLAIAGFPLGPFPWKWTMNKIKERSTSRALNCELSTI